jgi:hypothetical protein
MNTLFDMMLGVSKCLKVVNSSAINQVRVGDAMAACSVDNARLVSVRSCSDIGDLASGVYNQFLSTNQIYFIGAFTFPKPSGVSYRNWDSVKVVDS